MRKADTTCNKTINITYKNYGCHSQVYKQNANLNLNNPNTCYNT